ncbi:MAG: HupE/UreJ family protein [Acidobacteria bacterium]|nr:HupE/UreJ family protein [Acidobacteriota bacterium]
MTPCVLRRCVGGLSLGVLAAAATVVLEAHGVSNRDAAFVRSVAGAVPAPFMYLGAKHMVTGYDHLLFLVGVIFFLYRTSDVVKYVSLFTLGHSLTLLLGVLANIPANAYIIDAIIGLSVVYKGFENISGFDRVFRWRPDARWAVFVFGLFHGFGLATKLQELALPEQGLLANLLAFNIGVELGQVLSLLGILILFTWWRTRPGFQTHAFATNTWLMAGGFALLGYQLTGYMVNA